MIDVEYLQNLKRGVFLNPDSKFQSYSNKVSTIKCLIMKYDL